MHSLLASHLKRKSQLGLLLTVANISRKVRSADRACSSFRIAIDHVRCTGINREPFLTFAPLCTKTHLLAHAKKNVRVPRRCGRTAGDGE